MHFVKTEDLRPGMRLAKPIYNRMGVMLYERDTNLTEQGITSIVNFGLIGIFVLEPAEPVPPLSKEEIEFEQFQTIAMFQIRDDMVMLKNKKSPKNLPALVQDIIKRYGSLDHKLSFTQNIRSSTDGVYKHAISCAILAALLSHEMKLKPSEQIAVIYAALLFDFGLLFVPPALVEKEDHELTEDDMYTIRMAKEKGLSILDPDTNPFDLPQQALAIIEQMVRHELTPGSSVKDVKWLTGTKILHVANKFDELTSMSFTHTPASELMSMRYLLEFPQTYSPAVVNALACCIHILPIGACVDLSNSKRALVVAENPMHFLLPVVLDFESNELLDLSKPEIAKELQISDIMKTMDNRIHIDRVSLEQFEADSRIKDITERFRKKKIELQRRAEERERAKRRRSAEQEAAHAAEVERLKNSPAKFNNN